MSGALRRRGGFVFWEEFFKQFVQTVRRGEVEEAGAADKGLDLAPQRGVERIGQRDQDGVLQAGEGEDATQGTGRMGRCVQPWRARL